jgi:hypothetical protein
MDFIRGLEEARLTKDSNNLRSLTYTDCCERLYLTLLCLELLRQYPRYAKKAQAYAKKTLGKETYSQYRAFSTDLYNFIYFVVGDDEAINKLKNPGSAKQARQTVTLPLFALNRYLRSLSSSTIPSNIAQDFIKIESSLKITNSVYKIIRRNIINYGDLKANVKKETVTKLLFACRAKLRSSDIIDDLSALAAEKDLESPRVKDTEPKISTPDVTMTSAELALYRQLVGMGNVMMAKKFIEFAKQGNSIPPSMVQAYLPIIQMIDDIVNSGQGNVKYLQNLHQRAKKQRK